MPRRLRPLDVGMTALREVLGAALAEPAAPLDAACQGVTEMLHELSEDDMTLVLARIHPWTGKSHPRKSRRGSADRQG